MTTPTYPFGSDSWGTDLDDTVEIRTQTADVLPWTARTVYSVSTPVAFGQVEEIFGRPGWWPTVIPAKFHPRSLLPCSSPEEGMAAVEQVINELAADS